MSNWLMLAGKGKNSLSEIVKRISIYTVETNSWTRYSSVNILAVSWELFALWSNPSLTLSLSKIRFKLVSKQIPYSAKSCNFKIRENLQISIAGIYWDVNSACIGKFCGYKPYFTLYGSMNTANCHIYGCCLNFLHDQLFLFDYVSV